MNQERKARGAIELCWAEDTATTAGAVGSEASACSESLLATGSSGSGSAAAAREWRTALLARERNAGLMYLTVAATKNNF